MRTKCPLALLAGILVSLSGCHIKAASPLPEQSEPNVSFDIAQAMNMLYGNYDAKKQASVASLPKMNSSVPAADEGMTVRPLFQAFADEARTESFFLVTYAVPIGEPYDCHACTPTIGMAVFSRKGPTWTLGASNRAITSSGGWGQPQTDTHLVQIGPNRHAVKIIDDHTGQGETTAVLLLLIPWNDTVNLGLERIIADDDKGGCDPYGELACYANRRIVTFVRKNNVEYYDLDRMEFLYQGE